MKIIGHRGARNEAPENTVESFVHAFKNGCRHFELDIQLSADKELMIYHDKTLKRTSGINEKLSNLSCHMLLETDARLNTPGWHVPCHIPNLDQVYLAVPDTLSWQFEVKSDRRDSMIIIADKLIPLIKKYKLYEKCHVTSSNKWFLKQLKLKEPKIQTGFVCEFLYQRPVTTCLEIGANLLALNEKLASAKLVSQAHMSKIEISCWTVNTIERIDQLRKIGIESMITDEPSKMIAHYQECLRD
jgi:glycerophosphoryl diester phosphodiesterase